MNILVTGAAGFVGSHLCERLCREGHNVTGLDSLNAYYKPALKELNVGHIEKAGAGFVKADLASDDLGTAVSQADFVYHLAGQPGISATTGFDDYLKNNILATQRLLEACCDKGSIKGFVNICTSSVYGKDATGDEETVPRPTSHYGVTKLAAEQLVMALSREKGFPACSIRLFSVYGPRERPEKLYPKLIHGILEKKSFPLYEGSREHVRSFTYVGDIVEGLVLVLNHFDGCRGEIINLGTDRTVTTGEGIDIIQGLLGEKAPIEHVGKRPGDQLKTHARIDKARRLLGYEPCVTPEVGLERETEWFLKEIRGKGYY